MGKEKSEEERKISVSVLLTFRQYRGLNALVERRVFRSFSEAVREGVERILREHGDVLKEEVGRE